MLFVEKNSGKSGVGVNSVECKGLRARFSFVQQGRDRKSNEDRRRPGLDAVVAGDGWTSGGRSDKLCVSRGLG